MLAEFLQRVVDLAMPSTQIEVHQVPELPEKVFVRQGESFTDHDIPPARRNHQIDGLDDLVRAISDEEMTPHAEVFHSSGRIVAHLERADRRDALTFPLPYSSRFKTLVGLQAGIRFSVPEAVRFLRFELHGSGVERMVQALGRVTSQGRAPEATTSPTGRSPSGARSSSPSSKPTRFPRPSR